MERRNNNWKGGRIIDDDGYVLIKKTEHPNANNSGYVREHRLVMEEIIGRYLERKELVHHINGNRQDNRPENLMLVSHKKHMQIELGGKKRYRSDGIWRNCKRCGKEFYLSAYWKDHKYEFCSWECRYPKNTGIWFKCESCGKSFYKNAWYKNKKVRFCSKECTHTGEWFICKICNKQFYLFLSVVNKRNHEFCSRECKKKGGGKNKSKDVSLRKGLFFICKRCGNTFFRFNSVIKVSKNPNFCSNECRWKKRGN